MVTPKIRPTVRVYWNVRRKLWSVQEKVNGRWKVTRHLTHLSLEDARWHVSAAGRERVRREGRKVVHAYVEGKLMEYWTSPSTSCPRVRYNPHRDTGFHCGGVPVTTRTAATFNPAGQAFIPSVALVR